jgi:predicted ribosome quality control (RQC) complex YloA/Tae2 family protein
MTRPAPEPRPDRSTLIVRALTRYRAKLRRKLEGLRGDLAEAERAAEFRRSGETLLTYIHQVPARAERVALPDPADPGRNLEIALDPRLKPQENAARYFKRAAKSERGLREVPPRLATTEAELMALDRLLERVARAEEVSPRTDAMDVTLIAGDASLAGDLVRALEELPLPYRRGLAAPAPGERSARPAATAGRRDRDAVPARLQPRRLRTQEGWDVLIGRSNEGNDHVTHHLARPEDYWFHVHGAAGSHVVLRRGKGKNEPSKQTIEEVAAWTAYYSQARTAGKVPVIVTRKKYVRKPRKAPPGLVTCEREKTVMVKPKEPEKGRLADEI